MSGRRSISMDYEDPSDSSGTDDDLPPTHSGGRANRGVRVSGNGRAATEGLSLGVIYASTQPMSTVDQMIHKLEQEAYTAVLRAFGAQSEVITWAKERLMTDLRKELRVTDEQHREFLGKVGADETLRQIHRQMTTGSAPPVMEVHSRKKQKTTLVSSTTLPPPPSSSTPTPPLPPSVKTAPIQTTSAPKRGAPPGPRGKKPKGGRIAAGPKGTGNRVGRPPSKISEPPTDLAIDPYIGRRVKTRWPDDNTFYEAIISDYNVETGLHALVYDMDTENETWEWINLKEVPPGDLKWVEGPPVVGRKAPPPGARGMGRGMKRGGRVASPAGRGRGGVPRGGVRGWRGPASVENGSRNLELMPLEDLAKEVDKLEEDDDLQQKLENAKRAAKAHEEQIRKALAEVGESSDEGESDDAGQPPSSHTQSIDHERDHRSVQNSREHTGDSDEEETAGNERAEGSDGEHTVGEEGGAASDAYDEHQGEDGDEKDEDA